MMSNYINLILSKIHKLHKNKTGGRGRIQTSEGISRWIYSPDPLITWVTLPNTIKYIDILSKLADGDGFESMTDSTR